MQCRFHVTSSYIRSVVTAFVSVKLRWWDCLQRYNVDTRFQENLPIQNMNVYTHTHTEQADLRILRFLSSGKKAGCKEEK
jgi:hypothetical protein